MAKISQKPATMIYPLPAVMVSCGSNEEEYNIITIAWTGTICSNPPMCYISVRKNRHSYAIIKKNRDFVINLTTKDLAFATDWCGIKSGKNVNKFKAMDLTPEPSEKISAPAIKEAPVNIECRVKEIIPLGSHDMFIAEVVAIQADEACMNKSGEFDLNKTHPMSYSQGKYYELGNPIGKFGYSVKK